MKWRYYLFFAYIAALVIGTVAILPMGPIFADPGFSEPIGGEHGTSVTSGVEGDYWNLTPNETVTVEYRFRNWENESRTVNRTAFIVGPWNNTTGIIEDDYYDNDSISVEIPPDGYVETSATLAAPPEPGVYVLDMGAQSYGDVVSDGEWRVRVVNETVA